MKTINQTVQLEEQDLTKAVRDYLQVKGYNLVKAVIQNNIILAEVSQAVEKAEKTIGKIRKQAQIINRARKHAKINTGLFTVLKQWFAEERRAGTTEIPFHTVKTKLKENYPHLTEDRLAMYLYDRRQLPDIRFRKAEGLVKLSSKP